MKSLRLKRVSVGPNKFNNYCYIIMSGDTTGMSGIVERDGVKMLFSFSRVGDLSRPFNAQLDERKVGDKKYFNIIDTTTDTIGSIAHLANTAKRFGIGAGAVDAEAARLLFAGLNTQSKAQSQAMAEQPVVEETVVNEPVVTTTVPAATVDTTQPE